MTHEETVLLTRYVKACCPQQAIDRWTPDAWHDLLGHLDAAECRAAAAAVASRQPFVAPSEIIAEAERAQRAELGRQRRELLDRQLPPGLPRGGEDPRLTREQIDAIFAGLGSPQLRQLPPLRQSEAELEAERQRQLAALRQHIDAEQAGGDTP